MPPNPPGPEHSPKAQGCGDAPVLDADALSRLHALDPDGSRGFFKQLLTAYEASLTRHLARLAPSDVGSVEFRVAAEVAHTLKSSSASIGALVFSAACARLERAGKVGNSDDFVPALAAVRAEGDRVVVAVRDMLQI